MTTLPTTDIEQARQYFDQTRNRVLDAATGLTDEQWRFKPSPESWSIAENLEHMVIVEERVLGPIRDQLRAAPAPAAGRDYRLIDVIVVDRVPDRSIKAKAPDPIQPTGRFTPTQSLDRIRENYKRLAEFVESTPDLREHVLESMPLQFVTNGEHKTMDGYQWALTVAAHDERHVRQILEIQAHPDYPQSA